jgi:hypothetical protein
MSSSGMGLGALVAALVVGCGGGSVASIPPVAPVVAPSEESQSDDLMQELGASSEAGASEKASGGEGAEATEPAKPESAPEPAAKPAEKPAAKPAEKAAPKP